MVRRTVKQMLIDLYKEERDKERCALVHGLKEKAKEVTKPYMDQIDEWESDISTLNNQISGIRDKIRKRANDRDERLKEEKLYAFTHQTCGDALHENLMDFDKETNDHIRSILEGK